jgi:hypothetical protein
MLGPAEAEYDRVRLAHGLAFRLSSIRRPSLRANPLDRKARILAAMLVAEQHV